MEIVKPEKVGKRVSVLPSQTDKKGDAPKRDETGIFKKREKLIGTLTVRWVVPGSEALAKVAEVMQNRQDSTIIV